MNIKKTRKSEDKEIQARLTKLSELDSTYWEFRRQAKREGLHGLIQYPAMMVPQMQGDLLDVIVGARPDIKSALDPFLGAGTSMTEIMMRGIEFTGFDINPLAILTCKAKSQIFRSQLLSQKAKTLSDRLFGDTRSTTDVAFAGCSKWFTISASIHLSRIRRAIIAESDQWARQIFWVVLAETIRQTSNSRTSTYKLHIRPDEEIRKTKCPAEIFLRELGEACQRVQFHEQSLTERGYLFQGQYTQGVNLFCGDVITAEKGKNERNYDLMITSPPYGDNRTTIPYGQFSFLASNWILVDDLPGDPRLFSNTYATDTASLGGRVSNIFAKWLTLKEISPAFCVFIKDLQSLRRPDLESKVISFIYDFFDATTSILGRMRSDSYLVWTLGNRTVGGINVPLVQICEEFQLYYGASHVATVKRRIPSKRFPVRNSISGTMAAECLLVMRAK